MCTNSKLNGNAHFIGRIDYTAGIIILMSLNRMMFVDVV